jgi:pimeloyl-ACP methyl ester carboxylesterase
VSLPNSGAQQSANPSRKKVWRYLRAFLLGMCILLPSLGVGGATYEAIASSRALRRVSPHGHLVDMGGYRLHLYCTGDEAAAEPTVILESGLATNTSAWTRIQSEVSSSARVCSYDRGGIGWSDPSPRRRDAASIAEELYELLKRAHITQSLVVVGHSTGGLYARAFRARHPGMVAGLVLLDSSHEDQFSRTAKGNRYYQQIRTAYRILPIAAQLGLIRLSSMCDLPGDFPAEANSEFHATCSKASTWKAQELEVESLVTSMSQVKAQQGLGHLPLVVVSAGNDPQNVEGWLGLQAELAALSTDVTYIIRPDATHPGLLLNADEAHRNSIAIQNLVTTIRQRARH